MNALKILSVLWIPLGIFASLPVQKLADASGVELSPGRFRGLNAHHTFFHDPSRIIRNELPHNVDEIDEESIRYERTNKVLRGQVSAGDEESTASKYTSFSFSFSGSTSLSFVLPSGTEVPSASPTIAPTAPTASPTVAPTTVFAPSFKPTLAPSAQTSPIIEFLSNITLAGLPTAEIDEAGQTAILNASATAMGLAITSCTYLGAKFTEDRRRALFELNRFETLDFTADAETKTAVPLDTTDFDDPDALYDSLTSSLDEAVSDGSFTAQMNSVATSLGSDSLENAEATGVTNSDLILLTPAEDSEDNDSSSSEEDALDDGAIAGIVIGSVAFVAIVAAAAAYYFFYIYSNGTSSTAFNANKEIEVDL